MIDGYLTIYEKAVVAAMHSEAERWTSGDRLESGQPGCDPEA
jgi:hypothetical protein